IEEPRLSQRAGGLSGPELFPNVLETIRGLRRTVGPRIGLIATGGVDSPAKGRRGAGPLPARRPPRRAVIRRAGVRAGQPAGAAARSRRTCGAAGMSERRTV